MGGAQSYPHTAVKRLGADSLLKSCEIVNFPGTTFKKYFERTTVFEATL
jgi:hypothetical protein